ncbi:MAG: segregation/condensation protein A [Opitutae bacterium]|nr:segregation/condensation protein A [Opitutae bacterium]
METSDNAENASLAERAGISVGVPRDGLFPESAPSVRLSRFEGPLDLLLFLIRKNEIDICDIPIAEITRQYMEILHDNENANLEIAGDFFVMAATLMYIKSRALLPASEAVAATDDDPGNDDDLDPRWQLVRQLIQYKRLKESAKYIEDLIEKQQNFLPRQIAKPEEPEERPLAPLGKMDLWNVFNLVLKRLSERILPGEIHDDSVTIAARMEDILARLKTEKSFTFSSLMPQKISIPFLATTFLACLELARLGQMRVRQDEIFGEIYCDARDDNAG